ncbi:MAG TPA: arsenosugar biosynthesis radical SAM (seleno)protein ArsS [Casimicrobiaceae bacterium]|nr:arsenosugar biosynthesis radical SAM (seleno)protein ArsS [Casimicrobiaceae bacterium]
MRETLSLLARTDFPAVRRDRLEVLQVNVGYRCNQSCVHCHVAAGPNRTEQMRADNVEAVLRFLARHRIPTLDITGGAPELHPQFREIVSRARGYGTHVIDRCNLTVLLEPDQHDLPRFLAEHAVEIIASLPCYLEQNVDRQRGEGVFERSIDALQVLNALGYGREGTGLVLNLVYNPQGAALPPPQHALEADYRRELGAKHGVVFNRLYTLANMPIQRFGSMLVSKGQFHDYMNLLRSAHRPDNVDRVMCRNLVSVDWQGLLYDCDFNQMLNLPLRQRGRSRLHISELDVAALPGAPVRVADHCYGCTAGQGSSCGGALGSQM